MSDMNKRGPDCDDCCDEERGKRGKRGHRGHDGRDGHNGSTGPTGPGGQGGPGPTGPTGSTSPTSGGLLKFSGLAAPGTAGSRITYLGDGGLATPAELLAPNYPIPTERVLVDFAVNLRIDIPLQQEVEVSLILNSSMVLATATYVGGVVSGGIQVIPFGPTPVGPDDVIDVRVTVSFVEQAIPAVVSAMVGTQ